jgi:arsenate reductase
MVLVYQYPKCSTCRSALRWLDTHGVAYQSIDIVAAPPSLDVLGKVLKDSGAPVSTLFNRSGQAYREGNFKERLKGMSDGDALAALAADGKLIKRPLVISPQAVLVGFDAERYAAQLGALRSRG